MKKLSATYPREAGFTISELIMVLAIVIIVSAIAVSTLVFAVHATSLRGASSDFACMLQEARIYAIRDNRYYSTYVLAASGSNPQRAYVDMYPQGTTGASGNGGASVASNDPVVQISAEVSQQPASAAPNTSNLQTQLLPSNTPVTPTDATVTPITFGPRSLPCTVISVTGGSVCNTLGGPTAYWTFFQDSSTSNWQAVTVTPAGRIQQWRYDNSSSAWVQL